MKAEDRHPDRPQHPDFARLSEVVIDMDTRSERPGFDVQTDMQERVADPESVQYMAMQRVGCFINEVAAALGGQVLVEPLAMTAWMDGFMAGATFADLKADR